MEGESQERQEDMTEEEKRATDLETMLSTRKIEFGGRKEQSKKLS